MRQKQSTAEGADHRKGEGVSRRGGTTGSNAPFENREADNKKHKEPMLNHLGIAQSLDQSDVAQRPGLGIGAQEQEASEEKKEQRPVARPGCVTAAFGECEEADCKNDQAGPMMIVLRPSDVPGVARRQVAGAGHESLRLMEAPHRFGVELRLQRRNGEAGMMGCRDAAI